VLLGLVITAMFGLAYLRSRFVEGPFAPVFGRFLTPLANRLSLRRREPA
jgi:hypothetical protein